MTITLTSEEAQQVLDALNKVFDHNDWRSWETAIETLRARLSAPEPEPVAKNEGGKITWLVDSWPQNCLLYTTLPVSKTNKSKWIDEPQKVSTEGIGVRQDPIAFMYKHKIHGIKEVVFERRPFDHEYIEEIDLYTIQPRSFTYDQVKAHIQAALMSVDNVCVGEDITKDGVSVVVRRGVEVLHAKFYPNTPQREWQGLTDEEVSDLEQHYLFGGIEFGDDIGYWAVYRAIEAKLKEKNS